MKRRWIYLLLVVLLCSLGGNVYLLCENSSLQKHRSLHVSHLEDAVETYIQSLVDQYDASVSWSTYASGDNSFDGIVYLGLSAPAQKALMSKAASIRQDLEKIGFMNRKYMDVLEAEVSEVTDSPLGGAATCAVSVAYNGILSTTTEPYFPREYRDSEKWLRELHRLVPLMSDAAAVQQHAEAYRRAHLEFVAAYSMLVRRTELREQKCGMDYTKRFKQKLSGVLFDVSAAVYLLRQANYHGVPVWTEENASDTFISDVMMQR